MPRVALPELEDLPGCPPSLRDTMTDFLRAAFHLFGQYRPAAPLLVEALEATPSEPLLVDLGSGAGGPWPGLLREVDRLRGPGGPPVRVVLSDLYPNEPALDGLVAREPERFRRAPDPVDARAVPSRLDGVRTVFTAFHHFDPDDARRVLADAVAAGRPIVVLEVTRRSPLAVVILALGVLPLAFVLAPFVRPFRWKRLFWTYLVPLAPFAAAWDGLASCLRSYTPAELRALAGSVESPGWRWSVREVRYWKGWAPIPLTVLMGVPGPSHPAGAGRPDDTMPPSAPGRPIGSGAPSPAPD